MTNNNGNNENQYASVLNDIPEETLKEDEATVKLQSELEAAKKKNREERFCWIVVTIILLDGLMLERFSNSGASICILILEVALIVVIARRLEVEDIAGLIDKLCNWNYRRSS